MSQSVGILSSLPPHLAYLAKPAMKYGIHQFDADVDRFFENATQAEWDELRTLAASVRKGGHYKEVLKWLDTHQITEHVEASNLYFLFGLLDAAGLAFE
jgi:hypothetical protein